MSALCEAGIPVVEGLKIRFANCPNEATETYRYGCVHEHVIQKATCPDHHPFDGFVGCIRCLRQGHECPMAFQLVPR